MRPLLPLLVALWIARPVLAQDAIDPAPRRATTVQGPEEGSKAPSVPHLWLEAEVGASWMSMGEFAFAYGGWGSHLVPSTDQGVAVQGALGFRHDWLTLGARATTSRYSAYAVNVVGGEVGFEWPVRWLQPRIQLHAGYAWHGPADLDLPNPGLSGPSFGGGTGLRAPLGRWLVLGASFDMDLMWLTGKVRLADEGSGVDPALNDVYRQAIASGLLSATYSGQGYQLRVMITLGVTPW